MYNLGLVQVTQAVSQRIPLRPDRRVLTAPSPPPDASIEVHERTPFRSLLSSPERTLLATLLADVPSSPGTHPALFDGPVVRLDGLSPRPSVSVVGFFDLLTSNLVAFPDERMGALRSARLREASPATREGARALIRKVADAACPHGERPCTLEQALANPHLANVAAVSTLVLDNAERVGLVRRGAKVAIGAHLYASTAAGSVEPTDLATTSHGHCHRDPFTAAALRELEEETGLAPEKLRPSGVLMPRSKMQPVFCFTARLDASWDEIAPEVIAHPGFGQESDGLVVVDLDDLDGLVGFLQHRAVTSATAAHLWQLTAELHPPEAMRRRWRQACPAPCPVAYEPAG